MCDWTLLPADLEGNAGLMMFAAIDITKLPVIYASVTTHALSFSCRLCHSLSVTHSFPPDLFFFFRGVPLFFLIAYLP